jgi:hypothetical protein
MWNRGGRTEGHAVKKTTTLDEEKEKGKG